ncbi:MAG: class I mannose-6-phosphate isomerase [Clostridia bacterium]|nr:class I mannose-6-phosphate isomerase [Clostridia bacterium]
MKKYPLRLSYTAKSAIWGGSSLSEKWGKVFDGDNIAETWELSVREREMAVILNGDAEGLTLAEYFKKAGYGCVSPTYGEGDRFPLLVKLIDAAAPLSVQVHPDDAYASSVENDSGKTEMWYVVDAAEGAELVYGLREGFDRERFASAVARGEIGSAMNSVKVRAGDCFFIPAGMVHAIGEGILIAEIQQNSDLTYRVYDYDRVGADGKKRELHTKKALDVVRPYTEEEVAAIRYSEGAVDGMLANSKYFKVRKVDVDGEEALTVRDDSFTSLLCIDGEGTLTHNGEEYRIKKGDSYFLPAGMGEIKISGMVSIICSEI